MNLSVGRIFEFLSINAYARGVHSFLATLTRVNGCEPAMLSLMTFSDYCHRRILSLVHCGAWRYVLVLVCTSKVLPEQTNIL